MKTQQLVKINENNTLSILTWEDGTKEIAHLENNEISYKYMNDVHQTKQTGFYFEDEVAEIASEIIHGIISETYDVNTECDAQIIVENFSYNVWIAVNFNGKKITYDLCTVRPECKDEDKDKNRVSRSTFKGLMNYLNHFDR